MDRKSIGAQTGADVPSPTIFHEPWWLDAVADGNWAETVVESGGRIAGRLPYVADRKVTGHLSIVMPRLTRALGPALAIDQASDGAVRQPTRHKLIKALVDQLPRHTHIWLNMHRGVGDTMAFEEAGCTTRIAWTAEIEPDAETVLWSGLRDKTRNVIRRSAERCGEPVRMDADPFMDFYGECAREAGRNNDYATAVGAVRELVGRERGRVHALRSPDGEVVAAILVAWDASCAYYLMSARRPHADNGAVSQLIWSAIREAAGMDLVFDMDGINAHNRLLVTGFGGSVRPRYVVCRTSRGHAAMMALKSVVRR